MRQSKLTVPAEPHLQLSEVTRRQLTVTNKQRILFSLNDTSKLKSTENRTSPSVSTVLYERHCLVISYFRTTIIQLGALRGLMCSHFNLLLLYFRNPKFENETVSKYEVEEGWERYNFKRLVMKLLGQLFFFYNYAPTICYGIKQCL